MSMPPSTDSTRATAGEGPCPVVSVVVPVYRDWDRVPDLLRALRRQSLDGGRFEVLLVDNGSPAIPHLPDMPFSRRVLRCAEPGSYAARNAGIGAARGAVLAFTDADCRPGRNWLRGGLACLDRADDGVIVAGAVRMAARPAGERTAAELYDAVMGLPQARYVRRGYGVTANLLVPRSIVDQVGPFSPGRFSGGDAEFCRRAGRAGFGVVYCPGAVVQHPARRDFAELAGKARRLKGGQLRAGPLWRRLAWVVRTGLPPVRAWRRALVARDWSWPERLIVCRVQSRLWAVEVLEMLRLLLGGAPRR